VVAPLLYFAAVRHVIQAPLVLAAFGDHGGAGGSMTDDTGSTETALSQVLDVFGGALRAELSLLA